MGWQLPDLASKLRPDTGMMRRPRGTTRVRLLKHAGKLRSLIPQAARERLYEWHPGRARRWQRYPGLQQVGPGQVVLTFDDGPDPDATPAVLDALDAAGVRATFFVLGGQLEEHHEIGAEILRRGHEIGLHGYGHVRHDRVAATESRDDVIRGREVLEDLLGVSPRWYRPPYGKMSDAAAEACRSLGMSTVYWSAWGLDWEPVDEQRIVAVTCEQLSDGGIVLLHDSARYARRSSAGATADAIAPIAAWVRERGMSPVSLGEAVLGNGAAR